MNILNHVTQSAAAQFMDMLYSNALIPVINRQTRVTAKSSRLIYFVVTNNSRSNERMLERYFVPGISGHFPVFHVN